MATTRARALGRALAVFTATAAILAFPQNKPLPTAQEVLKRNIEATGGEEAIRKLRTLAVIRELKIGVRSGDINHPPVINVIATFRKAPDKALTVQRTEGHEARMGFDGAQGWEQIDGSQPRILKGNELAEMKRDADFYAVLDSPKWFSRISYDHYDNDKEQPAHVLKFVPQTGQPCYRYFDAKTFLEIKSSCVSPPGWAGGAFILFSDYRKVDGVMIAYHMEGESSLRWAGELETASGYFRSDVKDVQVNGNIDDAVFETPHAQATTRK